MWDMILGLRDHCTLYQSVVGWGPLPRGECNLPDVSKLGSSYLLRLVLKRKPLAAYTNHSWGDRHTGPVKGTRWGPRASIADP